MLRPYRGETGFRKGDGEAAVTDVVGRLHGAFGGQCNQAVNETFLGGEVYRRRLTCDYASDCFRVFARGEFAGEQREERFLASLGMTEVGLVAQSVQQNYSVVGFAEGDLEGAGGVLENAQDADDRRGIDRFAEGLVIEADVPAGDWCGEGGAGFGDTVDGLAELPHQFGLFRAAEVEAIRGRDGPRAAASHVARRFRDGVHRAHARIQLAPAAVAVGRERQRALYDARLRILDAHDRRIARARTGQRVRANRTVVLLGDPAFGRNRR